MDGERRQRRQTDRQKGSTVLKTQNHRLTPPLRTDRDGGSALESLRSKARNGPFLVGGPAGFPSLIPVASFATRLFRI